MKPAILTDPDESGLSWLVDKHSASVLVSRLTPDHRLHYETAVNLKDLRPGQFCLQISPTKGATTGPTAMAEFEPGFEDFGILPWPCVFAPANNHREQDFNGSTACVKGIYLPGAMAMLKLAAAFNNVRTNRVTESFTFNSARREGVEAPWGVWKFLTAWRWSEWRGREIGLQRRVPQKERWEDMKVAGYPHAFKTFQSLHRSLFEKPPH